MAGRAWWAERRSSPLCRGQDRRSAPHPPVREQAARGATTAAPFPSMMLFAQREDAGAARQTATPPPSPAPARPCARPTRCRPGASSSATASSRVSWTASGAPSASSSSARTSKPRCTTRSTIASRAPSRGSAVTRRSCGRTSASPRRATGPRKRHDEAVGRALVELARGADLLDAALVQDDDAVGDVHRLLLVVGDQHGGDVDLVVQAAQPRAQLGADLGVEGAEGLVEQQHPRLDRQRARERHALALAAAELRRGSARGSPPSPTMLEQLVDRSRSISAFGRLRMRSPKATFSRTVMCLNAA